MDNYKDFDYFIHAYRSCDLANKENYKEYRFDKRCYSILGNYLLLNNVHMEKVEVAGNFKIIGDFAFAKSCVINAKFEEGVEILGNNAFDGSYLEKISLPQSLKYIGAKAFKDTLLTDIVLPSNIEDVGENLFKGTASLEIVACGENLKKYIPEWKENALNLTKVLIIDKDFNIIDEYTLRSKLFANDRVFLKKEKKFKEKLNSLKPQERAL